MTSYCITVGSTLKGARPIAGQFNSDLMGPNIQTKSEILIGDTPNVDSNGSVFNLFKSHETWKYLIMKMSHIIEPENTMLWPESLLFWCHLPRKIKYLVRMCLWVKSFLSSFFGRVCDAFCEKIRPIRFHETFILFCQNITNVKYHKKYTIQLNCENGFI